MQEIRDELKIIRESQIRMEGDLKYHIKRTDTLEDMHSQMRHDLYKRVFELEKPLPFGTIAKVTASVVAIVSGIVGASYYVMKLFGK